jgi:hypothetical protein
MARSKIHELLLEAHQRGIKLAKEISIRTKVPLVVEKNGKIIEIPPKYKYVRVPVKAPKKKELPHRNHNFHYVTTY